MLKKTSLVLVSLLIFAQLFSSFALAVDNSTYYYFEDKVKDSFDFDFTLKLPTKIQFDSLFDIYSRNDYAYNNFYDMKVIYRDFTGDGIYEVAVIYYGTSGDKNLEIYKTSGNRMISIFSGKGNDIRINNNSFSITNVKYDGRNFNETYTYKWGNGKFLRTGYAKTYIKGSYPNYPIYPSYPSYPDYEKPNKITNDERALTVKSFLKARMQGDYKFAYNYLSKAYKGKVNSKDISRLVPNGKVTTIDIFDSQRGDWVVAVIQDSWGQSRVFKFVPVKEKDQYSDYKIDHIVEIPRAN